jgi:deferrochelatase/peroxidase EfeB
MDARPVAPAPPGKRPTWKLAPPHDARTQALVVTGFGALPTGRALFLEFGWPKGAGGGAWLKDLEAVAPVTDADDPELKTAALAFTWTGLKAMGLDRRALDSFSRPFREGMFQEDRLRRLGDRRGGKWLGTVIEDGPRWSANTPARDEVEAEAWTEGAGMESAPAGEDHVVTPITVHALLLLYDPDEASATQRCQAVEAALAPHRIRVVHHLPLLLDPDGKGISRDHYGFADGLSQPVPYDDTALIGSDGKPVARNPANGVPLGEILIGHPNGHREKAPGPIVPADPAGRPAAAGLAPHESAEGFFDLGHDGSYMVVRELKQDVAAFWRSMQANADRIRTSDPQHSGHVDTNWLAERVIGRATDGHLLCPGGYLPPDPWGLPDNDYLFRERDPHGVGCPAGSHVRRANPRDALAPSPQTAQGLLDAANNHRILRRGRKYGPKIADPYQDDGKDRGLLFVCLNTDIARQFEFVQQTWLFNSDFATLYDETDPLIGPAGRMTIREQPLRRIVDVETFVKMAGGDYFFLPSLPALRYLAML